MRQEPLGRLVAGIIVICLAVWRCGHGHDSSGAGAAASSANATANSASGGTTGTPGAGGKTSSTAVGSPASGTPGSTAATGPLPAVPAASYVGKVKTILVGLPPADAELTAVTADPMQLSGLITQWMALPQYQTKMLSFFANAFQQSQAQYTDFMDQGVRIDTSGQSGAGALAPYLLANLQESFARTALAAANANTPFTSLYTTNTFMMTPPLMAYYALLDTKLIPDNDSNANTLPALNALGGFTAADFATWNPVTITAPTSGQTTTSYTGGAALASLKSMVLNVPRVGFYTTPSFFAQWQTNSSNQARVTVNQAWIVGVGTAFTGDDTTVPQSLAAVDAVHSVPGGQCYSCHVQLDPARQYFRQTYSLFFHQQTDPTETSLPGQFAFEGVSTVGTGIADLGAKMAASNAFASTWVQRLCTYANSTPCVTTDPEFIRLTQVFVSSNYSWNTLVAAMFSSPIVTYASSTPTEVANQGIVTIARKTHLCALYSARLTINDICGLDPATVVPNALKPVQSIALGLSDDTYSRGVAAPLLVTQPSLFFYGGVRNMCVAMANATVDAGTGSKYVSTNSTAAIADFGSNLMGLGTSRAAAVLPVLQAHYAAAMTSGLSASNALKSTFVLACTAPTTVAIGE